MTRTQRRSSFTLECEEKDILISPPPSVRRSHVIREGEMRSAAAVATLRYYRLTVGCYSLIALRTDVMGDDVKCAS